MSNVISSKTTVAAAEEQQKRPETPGTGAAAKAAHRSNEKRVLLKDLTFNSTGIYKCEVSADSPHFHTYENQSVMVVVELPERGPTIHGGRSHYRVGDTARLNCTSSKSKPAAQLTWFINGQKATSPHLVEYYPWVHRDGLESRRLGLSFTVDKSHFLKGELVLKCQAVVAAIYTAVKEEDATIFEGEPVILEQREHLIHVRSGVPSVLPTSSTFTLVLAILICGRAVT
ncbi:cell adhesion molecule 2-like [Panulirus ornatus]|uniref:cell adhesion molecule 2-like n=1 Tax=Panulirus ornatus TaxID=150431 RepID=UPI003A8929D7